MNLNKVLGPLRMRVFQMWRFLIAFVPSARIQAFGESVGQIGAILVVNLDSPDGSVGGRTSSDASNAASCLRSRPVERSGTRWRRTACSVPRYGDRWSVSTGGR